MTGDEIAAAIDGFAAKYREHQLEGYTQGMTRARDGLSHFVILHLPTILAHLRAQSPEAVWDALKQRCASDPSSAKRLVMVSEDDVRAALRAAVTP